MDHLPEELLVDQLIDRILLLQKIEQGLKDAEEGNVISEDEMTEVMKKWLK